MINSIMTATDGSTAARAALTWSAQMAKRRGAHLDVVHVVGMPQAELPPEVFDQTLTDASAHLDAWIAEADASDAVGERLVEVGSVSDRIAHVAAEAHPDLLVLGVRASDGATRLGLGSTAHQVVHDYHGALAAVGEATELSDATQVVVGVDGSAGSDRALRWAVDLSAALSTDPLAVFVHDSAHDPAEPPALAAVESQVAAAGPVKLRVLDGDPVTTLAQTASEFPSAILVVGVRSHGPAQHELLGRVPMELLHHCQRPVVVINGR